MKCGQLGPKRGDVSVLGRRGRKERRMGCRRLAEGWGTSKAGKGRVQGRGAAANGRQDRFEVREGDLGRVFVVPDAHSAMKKGLAIVPEGGKTKERSATERLGGFES